MNKKLLPITFSILFIVSCGGGGGGGGSTPTTPTTPAPTVNLSAEPTSAVLESTSTLTWSSSNATSCSASWTSQTGTSGSEAETITTAGNNSFSISCTGAGGSRSASVTVEGYRETDGVVVDGYISGAAVFIDEDDDWVLDSNENSTTSDNEGKFTIRYANGNLVSIGGTDLDSQTLLDNLLITHKLTGHSDFKAVTPVTSVAAFMEDASLLNTALGIDSSIDVFTFDPVANKGDGGIYDYLYEKGNQLTVLAFALQNITNDLNTTIETTQDYFKAITEEIEKEYTDTETKVNIETETFITNVIKNVIETKSVTIDETAKVNTIKALAGILPVIEVKSSDDLTTAVIRFAVSTLQTDIQAIANGTATAETITSYTSDVLTYIAEDQNVDSDEIAPNISAIADSAITSEDTAVTINVVANDSYVTTAPVSITTSNGINGSTTIAESSPEQIVYTPDLDYNGTDTFTYTLTQGEKTSSADVTVSIEAVNDAPTIDIASTIQVEENQTAVTTVSVSDVDEDELTLTLGGTDADSFNLSDDNVLTFKEAPDYETKSSYVITLSLTDGAETVTKNVTIKIISTESNIIFGDILPSSFEIDLSKSDANLIIEVEFENSVGINLENLPIAEIVYESSTIDTSGIQLSIGSSSNYSKYKYLKLSQWRLQSGNSNKGIFRANGLLPQYLRGGLYNINSGYFYDINGNRKNKTQNKAIKLIVEGDAPELSNLTISSNEVDVSSEAKTITLTVNVKDVSGINLDNLPLARIDAKGGSGSINADSKWKLKSGTEYDGIYETTITIPKDAVAGDYLVATGNFYDVHGNLYYLLSLYGSDSGGITISSSVEGDAPELSNLTISSNEVDVSSEAKTITLTVNVKDVSGINLDNLPLARIDAKGGSGSINADSKWKLKSGTEYDGIYETTITIPKDAVAGDYLVATGNFYDVHGSYFYILTGYGVNDNGINVTSAKEGVIPTVSEFTVNPNKVYVLSELATINLTIKASDESGIDDSRLAQPSIYQQNGALSISSDKTWERTDGDIYDGTYTASIEIPKGSIPGSYSINSGYFYDTNGNFNYENSMYGSASGGLDIFNEDAPANTAPVFTSSSSFTVAENQTSAATITVTDADNDSISFSLSGTDADSFAITSSGALTFNNAPDYETKATYAATVTASDGTNSTIQDITVNVTDVTEAVAVDDSSSGIEDDNIRVNVLTNDTFNSADVTLTATDGTNMSVEVQNDATSVAEYGHPTIIYSPDANWFGTDTFTYTVSSGGESDQGTVTVTVTFVNDAPTITSEATFSAAENQTDIGTVTATDIEDDTLTYSISGSDISIDSSTGVMTFNSAPDYETTTSYSATVKVSDGTDSDTQDITVNITNVVENSSPVFTSNSSFTVAENQTSAATITATDADNDSISFSLSGTDADSFAIASSGALTFNNAPDYETKESYSLIVIASDGTSSVSQTITITISNVNEVPQISALSSTLSPDENQTSIVTVNANDPDANTSLTYSVSGTDSSLFSISSSGALTFKTAPDYETPGDADADNSYLINVVVSDGSLSVTQAITIQVQNVADLISGVAVDGYVAGATVFQDLNNDGDLDSGEPSAATNSLGSFSLNLSSVNINAPVRIYNGFDLASNEIHPSVMDISVSETGSYIVTPISTLVGRLKIEDTSLSAMVPQSMIAGALGISLVDSPNDSILGFDPIAYFNGSDTTLAAEARPVFAASQLLMTMGGGNYSVHKYITDQVLSSLSSTLTTAAGSSITLSSANDILGLKQDAYDAIFNGYVDTTLANNPPINSIQFRNNKAVMTDYLNGSSSSAVNYSLYGVHDGTTTLVADLVGAKLDYDNLKQILDNESTGTPMDLNFELANIPAAGSGSTGVTLKLFYGDDISQDTDEDYLQITLTANWESDGTNFKIKLPANSSITASFYDRGGTILSITPTNQVEDIFTVTKDGPNRPATLSLRLSKLFNAFPTEVTGLSSFLDGAAEFTYLVEFDNFTIYDHLDNTFTKIQGTFEVDANPGITVFADDIYVHENATSKDISFYLSQAASSDVTLDYAIADASTASSSDYTLSSGTVTIPAGSMSATLTIPVTNDTTVEAQEEIRLTLSNVQNAVLGRSTVSAFITDGEEILANSTQKAILADNIFKDSKASINAYIKNKLDTSTITISGTSYTYSQVLINNSVTTDVYAYLDSIIDDYEVLSETLISTIMTKADAYIDAQLSSFADYSAFATALTQLNSGIKGLNMSQIVGTNINSNGSFPSGQNTTTLQTALDGKVDTLVTLAADTVADILGTDTNTNFPNANVIMGTDGDDTIDGTSGSDLIATFNGTDTVNPSAGNDKILGGEGVDTLNGGDDNDHIYGYAGADILNGNTGDDLIYGGKDNDTIDGDAGDDSLYGEAGNDTLTSGTGSDTVSGGLGNDTITLNGAGNKTIDGGTGTDSLSINHSGLSSFRDFTTRQLVDTEPTDGIYSGTYTFTDTDDNTITFTNIAADGLTILDIPFYRADHLTRTFGCGWYQYMGYATTLWRSTGVLISQDLSTVVMHETKYSDDFLGCAYFKAGFVDWGDEVIVPNNPTGPLTIYGGNQNDWIVASADDDTIYAESGDDRVMGGDGSDTIYLAAGDDAAYVEVADLTEDAVIDGGEGTDILSFYAEYQYSSDIGYGVGTAVTIDMTSLGNATNFENLEGTKQDDTLTGDTQANSIYGAGGSDTIYGGAGNDTLTGDAMWTQQVESEGNGGNPGNDVLYGQAGDDVLIGNNGDDTLDGGAGTDTLTGGNGTDTFVIRVGDGGDTITDFADGTDLIGMDGLVFTDLVIEQSGNDTLIKKDDIVLATLSNITSSNIDYQDLVSTSTEAQTINGTNGNDTLLGGSGNDTITTGAGDDVVYAYGGNDTITLNGAGNKTIDGGTGTDSLSINHSGLSSFRDFTTRQLVDTEPTDGIYSGTYTFTDTDDNTITFTNIAADGLTILDIPFYRADHLTRTFGCGWYQYMGYATTLWRSTGVLISQDLSTVVMHETKYSDDFLGCAYFKAGFVDWGDEVIVPNNPTGPLTIYGGNQNDWIVASADDDTIYAESGDDRVMGGDGSDTIYLAAGDDAAYVEVADLTEDAVIDGGEGTDILSFYAEYQYSSDIGYGVGTAVTIDMTSLGNATNFENLEGTKQDDTLTGDTQANSIYGAGGSDTIYGGAGNDTLTGDAMWTQQVESEGNGGNPGNDVLYGQAGDDVLIGNNGDDTLDGGAGTDTLTGGNGTDTFVIRVGDGGDTITDFADGTDLIGMDGLVFTDLVIEQSGNDTLIKKDDIVLATLSNITSSNIDYQDLVSTSTEAQTINGTNGNDTLLGGSGNDTITTGAGDDVVYAYGGNDTITLNGAGNKTIDGGTGTDSLSINHSGLSSFRDFTTRQLVDTEPTDGIYSGTYTFTDTDDNTITFTNIAADGLTILDIPFYRADHLTRTFGCGWYQYMGYATTLWRSTGVLISQDLSTVVMHETKYSDDFLGCAYFKAGFVDWGDEVIVPNNPTGPLTIYGGNQNDWIVASADDDTIYAESGDDRVMGGDGSDTIYLAAGDDAAYVEVADLTEDAVIDGGEGTDILSFYAEYQYSSDIGYGVGTAVTIDMTSLGNATNFENLEGTKQDDTLTGDTQANSIYGAGGSDTIYGGAGNDTLTGDAMWTQQVESEGNGGNPGNDVLYGQAGDDVLIGNNGDDTLDGGAGTDTLTGGNGTDTFVIRVGDGGSSIADADTIQDFTDGTDLIGMSGLEYSQLTIEQGTGDYANHVVVKKTDTGEFLVIIQNTSLSSISNADFSAI